MSTCGNPEAEKDMIRRPRFDKSRDCVRCKKSGRIVIRHTVYCKECFVSLVSVKFRRSLEPLINALPDGPRRKAVKARGNLLLGFSGGLGSTVLLGLVHQTYFSLRDAPIDEETGKAKGGRNHPRNDVVWPSGAVCYIETCSVFPGMKDNTEEIRDLVANYYPLEFLPLRLEDAFDEEWWLKMGNSSPGKHMGIDITDEGLPMFESAFENLDTPVARLRFFMSSLPTQTAVSSAVQTLIRLLLLYTAMLRGSSHLLLGTSLTSVSISLISSISQGSGFTVREEAQEDWIPKGSLKANGHAFGSIRVVRPLQDIGIKECAMWTWWSGGHVIGQEELPLTKQSIWHLTRDFVTGLERDYPSTVSTIARTCAKLAPKENSSLSCLFCERPAQARIQEWKSRISIRSLKDSTPKAVTALRSLAPLLCYMCHTTLISRSSRGTRRVSPQSNCVPLPVWIWSNMQSLSPSDEDTAAIDVVIQAQEVWMQKKMDDSQIKATIADFLFEDS